MPDSIEFYSQPRQLRGKHLMTFLISANCNLKLSFSFDNFTDMEAKDTKREICKSVSEKDLQSFRRLMKSRAEYHGM